jgi:hypothetical protein
MGAVSPSESDKMNNTEEVSEAEFYKLAGSQNIHPRIDGRYPFTSVFLYPAGREFGRKIWDGKNRHNPKYRFFCRSTTEMAK